MANIEVQLVNSYRKQLLDTCQAAAFIRRGIASYLDSSCSTSLSTVGNKITTVQRFFYADKIPLSSQTESAPLTVDVQAVKSRRDAAARTKTHVVQASAALRRLERLECAAAAPDSSDINPLISDKITELQMVSNFKILQKYTYLGLAVALTEYRSPRQNAGRFGQESACRHGSPPRGVCGRHKRIACHRFQASSCLRPHDRSQAQQGFQQQ